MGIRNGLGFVNYFLGGNINSDSDDETAVNKSSSGKYCLELADCRPRCRSEKQGIRSK